MSKPGGSDTNGGKEMKGLVAAAAMVMAEGDGGGANGRKSDHASSASTPKRNGSAAPPSTAAGSKRKTKTPQDISAARARRLEQNRRAAVESRRRKKVMIAELQRSVSFYTKANESLRTDNLELERRLFLARRGVAEAGGEVPVATGESTETGDLKPPPEEVTSQQADAKLPPTDESTEPAEPSQEEQQPQQQPVAPVIANIPFPPLLPSVSPTEVTDQAKAHATATQALYETMGYPSGAARAAASTLSQFAGLTTAVPTAQAASVSASSSQADAKPNAIEPVLAHVPQVRLPPLEEVGTDKYIDSLKKYAMQQTALANSAAAAANAAIQALNWHKMMKTNGTKPESNAKPPPSVMVPSAVPSTASSASKPSPEEEEPPSKKQKS